MWLEIRENMLRYYSLPGTVILGIFQCIWQRIYKNWRDFYCKKSWAYFCATLQCLKKCYEILFVMVWKVTQKNNWPRFFCVILNTQCVLLRHVPCLATCYNMFFVACHILSYLSVVFIANFEKTTTCYVYVI